MAEDDIYGNKARYHRFLASLEKRASGEELPGRAVYRIKNPVNIQYFHKLVPVFEAKDLSYIHRIRQFSDLLIAAHVMDKDFADVEREDMNQIVAYMHTRYNSAKSKHDFIKHMRYLWKLLFPVKDEQGYIEDKVYPYPVKHLSPRIDRSKKRLKNDRLTWEEFKQILDYFAHDRRIQAYIMLAMESLGRPQEILLRKLKHIELHETHAKVWLTERGKEGPGLLQCIDSYPYLVRWLEEHPLKDNPEAYVFINTGDTNYGKGMSPYNMNKHIRTACKRLGISKKVTCYSLKRNGVTFRRLRGDTDLEIQHAARWVSSEQLKTYDLSCQEDAFQAELIKRGIVKADKKHKHLQPSTKQCIYCGMLCGFTERFCKQCKRPLDRREIKEGIKTLESMQTQIDELQDVVKTYKRVADAVAPIFEANPHLLEQVRREAPNVE